MNKQYKVKPWYTDPEEFNLSAQDVQDMLNFSVECGAIGGNCVKHSFPNYVNNVGYRLRLCNYWGLTVTLYTSTCDDYWKGKPEIKKVSSLQELKDLFSEGIEQEPEEVVVEDRYKFLEGVGSTELRTLELIVMSLKTSKLDLRSSYGQRFQNNVLVTEDLRCLKESFNDMLGVVNHYGIGGLLTKEELDQQENTSKVAALEASIKSQQEELDKLKQEV